ncbi:hypothetical protein HFP15_10135 [Amycolatopsis sp. K13G38]|uniref:Uncharacterized protein n=1 Tax=Amycolatopsis acididurans TaxID=2724524 RepID=A0ABX1J0F0_9PSEU|nr:hypothetical protein [Amycolatopsis acididurans]NKQ53241.1 hypothetical protein [Amycolatopsis acididurans]
MRKPTRTRLARTTRRLLTTTALAAMFTGAAFTGSASASTVLASGCTGNVVGNMGDQVAVQGKDVAALVKAGAQERPLFLSGVDPDKLANEITADGALPVGQVPNAANGPISGQAVATAVTTALKDADGLGWWSPQQRQDTLDAIGNKVAGNCGLTAFAGNFTQNTALPTVPQTGGTAAPGGVTPGVSGTGTATAPPRNYGNIPAAVPGLTIPNYGNAIPGYGTSPTDRYPTSTPLGGGQPLPQIGSLGGASGQTDVRDAGNANSLAAPEPASDVVRLPMLLAVVALAGVSAALVRTWVLRKLS